MAKIKLVVSEPATGKASNLELEGPKAKPFVGRELGETLDGSLIGLGGRRIKITGGSDKDGIPLRGDVLGGGKKHLVLTKSLGFRGEWGSRERKMVRGRMITEETYQINVASVEASTEPKTVTKTPKSKTERVKDE